MMKRVVALLCVFILIFASSNTAFACNENQTDIYVKQILFGDSALSYNSNENVDILLSALFLCCEQSDESGAEQIYQLKNAKVGRVPTISDINVEGSKLFECSHNSWEYESECIKKVQKQRKNLLRKTVTKIFDFEVIDEVFKSRNGKVDSFAALLYYLHILSDYLADDPASTEVSAKGYDIPAYSGKPYIEIEGNVPKFTIKQKQNIDSFKEFSDLDDLGRCGIAIANVCNDTIPPANSRQSIGNIKPSGWEQQKYAGIVNSEPPYLYNRCHLIAHQLVGEDGNKNLITGTRYLNETGMKPFEDMVAKYVRETNNHVLYRVTPVFVGNNMLASGVQLEAYSIEDKGEGISFNVYCYNVQPGVDIDYLNGKNSKSEDIYEEEKVIPFAILNASDDNPDLIYEMSKHLEVVFEEQKNSSMYRLMMNQIHGIADEARMVGSRGENAVQQYAKLKEYQYEYFEILKEYMPKLLKKEEFFNCVFQ